MCGRISTFAWQKRCKVKGCMIHDEVDYCLCASDAVFGNRYVASASFLVSTPVCYRRLLRTQKGATHPGCSSPFAHFTQYLTALRAWSNQCLPGRSYPDVLPPGIVEMRGSMVIRPRPCMTWSMVLRLRPCMIMSTPNPPAEATCTRGGRPRLAFRTLGKICLRPSAIM